MTISEIDKQIAENETKYANVLEEMDDTKNVIIQLINEFSSEWFDKEMDRVKRERPEDLKDKGQDSINKLRSDFESLKSSNENLVREHIEEYVNWPNENNIFDQIERSEWHPISHFRQYGRVIPSPIEEPLRKVLGRFGVLMAEYGIQLDQYENRGSSEYRFKYGFEAPRDLLDALGKYGSKHEEAVRIQQEIKRLKKERTHAEVEELWHGKDSS